MKWPGEWRVRLHGKLDEKAKRKVKRAALFTLTNLPSTVAKKQLGKRKGPYILDITFLSTAKMTELNSKYRKKNRPTDVLSFSHLEAPHFLSPETQVGELFLCPVVVRKQAKEYGVTFENEMTRMTIHGVLHVFGYDHEKDEKEARKMFRLQDRLQIEIG